MLRLWDSGATNSLPPATYITGHMSILDDLKTCRKGLHQYPSDKKRCPECYKETQRRWREQHPESRRKYMQRWYAQNRQQHQENGQRWYAKNREKQRENGRKWHKQNLERALANMRRWREQNPEQKQKTSRRWYEKTRDQNREKDRERSKLWYAQNPAQAKENGKRWREKNLDRVRFLDARRRAKKKQATPAWADPVAINAIYSEALRLEKETGMPYEVDHVFPLQSKYMCGLHVENNLQILTQEENRKKSNRTWPGQLACQKDWLT